MKHELLKNYWPTSIGPLMNLNSDNFCNLWGKKESTQWTLLNWLHKAGLLILLKGAEPAEKFGMRAGNMKFRTRKEQDRQRTYSVTFRRVPATMCQRKTNKYYIFWVCACSLRYPACNAHMPCYILTCGLFRIYNIFPHYLIIGMIGGRIVIIYI